MKKGDVRKKNNKGFTLVELIIVIAVLGILMALAVPRVAGFTDRAKKANNDQLLALIQRSVDIYIGAGDITYPTTTAAEIKITSGTGGVPTYEVTANGAEIRVATNEDAAVWSQNGAYFKPLTKERLKAALDSYIDTSSGKNVFKPLSTDTAAAFSYTLEIDTSGNTTMKPTTSGS